MKKGENFDKLSQIDQEVDKSLLLENLHSTPKTKKSKKSNQSRSSKKTKSRNRRKTIIEDKTTGKTKEFDEGKNDDENEYINQLKEKRDSHTESNLKAFLPGEIGHYEDANILKMFKNHIPQRPHIISAQISDSAKRNSVVSNFPHDSDLNFLSSINKTLSNKNSSKYNDSSKRQPKRYHSSTQDKEKGINTKSQSEEEGFDTPSHSKNKESTNELTLKHSDKKKHVHL